MFYLRIPVWFTVRRACQRGQSVNKFREHAVNHILAHFICISPMCSKTWQQISQANTIVKSRTRRKHEPLITGVQFAICMHRNRSARPTGERSAFSIWSVFVCKHLRIMNGLIGLLRSLLKTRTFSCCANRLQTEPTIWLRRRTCFTRWNCVNICTTLSFSLYVNTILYYLHLTLEQ